MAKPREVKPFKIWNFLSDKCDKRVEELTTDSKNGFSFKVKKNEEVNQLAELKNFENFSCEVTFHKLL